MSGRPTDWSSVDRDCDPTPGDPVVVRDGGQKYQTIAGALSRAAATLRRLNGGASSGSDSVVALLEDCDEIAEQLSTAQNRYQAAGDALVTYAYALDQIQATTLQALYTANRARESMAENNRLADQYARWASYADTPERAEDCAYYLRMEAAYRTAATGDQSTIDQQKQIIDQAVADRDRAANAAISQIEDVTSTDGLNDSWWDDWGAKIVTWIADIAEAIASIAGILALVVCWIPVIGQALAGVLMVIAAVTSIIAALGNIALAATGERTWTQAVISIVGAALACVGLGALKGAFTGLKAGMGAWKAAGGLAGQGGLKAVGLASVKNLVITAKGLPTSVKSMIAGIKARFGNFKAGGGSGPWVPPNARPAISDDGVVTQITDGSCLAAAGEMVTGGEVSQQALRDLIGDWSDEISLRNALRQLTEQRWSGGLFPSADAAVAAVRGGPMVATLRLGSGWGHAVFVSPIGDDMFKVLDPWANGAVYEVGFDWVRTFVSGGVFH